MLKYRLPLLVLGTIVVALAAVSFTALALFERQQFRDQGDLLVRELDRVTALLRETVIGEAFLDSAADLIDLQFVRSDGAVTVPADADAVIPLAAVPTATEFDGRPVVVASRPWLVGGSINLGTIRMAYDTRPALVSRNNLRAVLIFSGALIAAVAGLAGVLLVNRQLRPLSSLAHTAGQLDPATPEFDASGYGDDEVGSVARALKAATDAIAERTMSERRALGAVAHELGAPLSVMAGQLEALSAESADPRLLAARDAANELLYTSQDLLALAQGELRTRVDMEVVGLGTVVESVARAWQAVMVSVQGDDLILGSPVRLAQVVRNLLRNAFQSGAERVRVDIDGAGDVVTLMVADDGPGIPEADWPQVFSRDYSGNAAGNGIGLTVVRHFTEAHGGIVRVGRSAEGGAEFRLEFPSLAAELEG